MGRAPEEHKRTASSWDGEGENGLSALLLTLEANSETAAILVDELDACRFDRTSNSFDGFFPPAEFTVNRFKPSNGGL